MAVQPYTTMFPWIVIALMLLVASCVNSGSIKDIVYTELSITNYGYTRGQNYGCATISSNSRGAYVLCIAPYSKADGRSTFTKHYAVLNFDAGRNGYHQLEILDVSWTNVKSPTIGQVSGSVQVVGLRGDTLMVNFWKAVNCVYREYEWTVVEEWRGKVKRTYYRGTISREKPPDHCK